MRSRLVALFTFCVLVSSLPVLAQEPGQRVLTPGCWGEDVFWCQRKLMDIGLLDQATGRYDAATQKAIKELQRAHGLAVDGFAGPLTFQVLDNTEAFQYYKVQSGDSLYKIAKQFDTSMEELVALNSLTDTNLRIGQHLRVPRRREPLVYIVKPGDNLYDIARKYGITIGEITKLNNIEDPALLKPGQELLMPETCNQ
ncbi:MAG: LysM peptidoglycan-binding domain-containing protein [Firmicutes bacterium]|nr:LysM peptidoglycan-binding domain-containing protein [Bacillota bacterium]